MDEILKSPSQESLGHFQANLTQSAFGRRGTQFYYNMDHLFFEREMVSCFSLNQYHGIIIALRKSVYWLELFLM